MTTRGDQILDQTLSKVGGKGLFVKELENALSDGRADLAVHSLKDMPMELPAGFALAAVLERGDPCDALVSPHYPSLDELPPGAVVGTSSLRREAMLRARYPHLDVRPLRGNLDTRLAKLDRGEYAAIILAAAGLQRLGLGARIRAVLPVEDSLPAAGQGALGIEIRAGAVANATGEGAVAEPRGNSSAALARWLAPLHHRATALAVSAERAVSRDLGGSCDIPLAAYAHWHDGRLHLSGWVATPDADRQLSARADAIVDDLAGAEALGRQVADQLAAAGAHEIVRVLSAGRTA